VFVCECVCACVVCVWTVCRLHGLYVTFKITIIVVTIRGRGPRCVSPWGLARARKKCGTLTISALPLSPPSLNPLILPSPLPHHTHAQTHAYTYTHVHTHAHTHTHMRTHTPTHVHTRAPTPRPFLLATFRRVGHTGDAESSAGVYVCVCVCACVYACVLFVVYRQYIC
jgi:hypothetical protein